MKCPFCEHLETYVSDSRSIDNDTVIRRRRICAKCHKRFTTHENIHYKQGYVIKKDGNNEKFIFAKLVHSIEMASNKNSMNQDQIVSVARKVLGYINHEYQESIASETIGKLVLKELYKVNQVACIRYASAYLDFNQAENFIQFIQDIAQQNLYDKT